MKNRDSVELLKSIERNFKALESLLSPLKFKDRKLRKNCVKLKHEVKQILNYAHEYDFDGVEANGFWSFVRLIDKFAQVIVKSFVKHNHRNYDVKLDVVSTGLVKYLAVVAIVRKATTKPDANCNVGKPVAGNNNLLNHVNHRRLPLSCDSYTTITCFKQFLDTQREQGALHGHYPGFWLCESVSGPQAFISLLTAVFAKLPFSIWALWDVNYRGQLISECSMRASRDYPFAIWNLSDLELVKQVVRFANRKIMRSVTVRTVLASRQTTYYLPDDGQRVEISESGISDSTKIRCRFLEDTSRMNSSHSIFLHCHGGALMAQSPDSHEGYLIDWTSKLGGVPILSIDYSLGEVYPTAYQEVLDVYLWLTSGSKSVMKQLGFHPRKVVLVGDSAGGSLCLSLCLMMHDIKESVLLSESDLPPPLMPSAVVNVFSGFRSVHTTPSKALMAMIDPVVSPAVNFAALGALGVSSRVETTSSFNLDEWSHLMPKISHPLIKSLFKILALIVKDLRILGALLIGLNGTPWFRKSNYYVKETMAQLDELFTASPYLTPVDNYKNLNAVKETSLHLITTHFDPCLDDNVSLAKTWKGPVSLDVLDELPHGFLYFRMVSKEAQAASDLVVKKLRAACLDTKQG